MYDYERKKELKTDSENIMIMVSQFVSDPDIDVDDIKAISLEINIFYDNHLGPKSESESLKYYYEFIRKILCKVMIKYHAELKFKNDLFLFKGASLIYNEIKIINLSYKEDLKSVKELLIYVLATYKEQTNILIKESQFNLK